MAVNPIVLTVEPYSDNVADLRIGLAVSGET